MRIVAGEFGGRTILAPKGTATRPMTDKVRAALFDVLGPIIDWSVLDAYAGSGAVGFEALSRGAGQVVAVEQSRLALQAIETNQQQLDLSWGYALYASSVETWLARHELTDFNLIVADPPYAQLKADVLEKLGDRLRASGVMVVACSSRGDAPALAGLQLARRNVYGDTALAFYQSAKTG